MKIIYGTVQTSFLFSGGAQVQLMKTKEYLENMGNAVELFNQWRDYKPSEYDIFHLFMANTRTYFLGKAIKEKGFKFALSPIFIRETLPGLIKCEIKVMDKWPFKLIKNKHFFNDHLCGAELTKMADIVLPNTKVEAEYIMKCWGISNKKIVIIPNGVDRRFAFANPDIFRQKYGKHEFLLGVGSLGGRKNFDLLIKVAKELGKKLVLIGNECSDIQGKKIQSSVCKNDESILILNYISHNDPLLTSAYAACDVFVLPSDFETPGLAALEAALAGAKVIITERGGTKEYFKDMVEYIKPKSKESLKMAIIKASKKKKNEELKNHILNNYIWEKVAEKTYSAYKQLLRKN